MVENYQTWDGSLPIDRGCDFGRVLGIPLKIVGNVIGVITLADERPGGFTSGQVRLVSLFADQAAIAIENARLNNSLRRQAAEAAALYRASTSLLTAGSDLQSVCDQITRTVTQEFTSAHCGVLLVDKDAGMLKAKSQAGYLSVDLPELLLDGPGLTVAAYCSGQPVYVADVAQDPRFVIGAEATRSELAIPLKVGDNVVGVLNLESPVLDAFDEHDQRVFSSYAERASLAIQNALLFESIEQHGRQIALLGEITASALATSCLDQLLPGILEKLRLYFMADSAGVTLWDEHKRQVIPFAIQGDRDHQPITLRFEPGKAFLTTGLLETGQPTVIHPPKTDQTLNFDPAAEPSGQTIFGLPLIAEHQKLGAILITFHTLRRLSPPEVSFGEQAARQIALAIARIKTLEMAHRHAQEAENLRLANSALTSSLDLREVLNHILDHLEQVIAYDSACVFMVQGDHLHTEAAKGFSEPVAGLDYPLDDSLLLEASRLGRPMILADVSQDPRYRKWGGTVDIHGWMGVPLIGKGETIGYLTIDSRQVGAFDEEKASLAQVFANQASIAIENARLYFAEKQRRRELEALHTAVNTLVSTLEIQVLIERIILAATGAIPAAQKGLLLMVEGASSHLKVKAAFGFRDPPVKDMAFTLDSGYAAQSVKLQSPLLVNHLRPGQLLGDGEEVDEIQQIQSAIIAPLIIESQVSGVISLGSATPTAFSQSDLRLLTSFASTVAVAIHNAQLHADVQELAITDPLTGLYNRRGFLELGRRELNRALRPGYQLTAIMIDADLLKVVNDAYGHDMGDLMLRNIAEQCRQNLRKTDIVCRYGGDEFAILLPDSDLTAAVEIAERLRQIIAAIQFQSKQGPIQGTISLGVANLDPNSENLDVLLERADRALYHAKQAGRNCVSIWQVGGVEI